ncbi:dihydrofolate reductase [Conexibacter sp. JD483]|uniref:dihydrofolate reductase n=1 Tax=unclassified Conexibacter TaxID=2627773 RepID=UPI002724C08E|nr:MULTISPECIES: dihydrofolate reductase [unclassified Conexibacter]MDO8185552.1 dihydrofolate reductase [Conexibacter sp. CPCC 205706]MDO8197261.1 dihydrofolate reductase [Conexibacter sp. CPCC 205762]MDR9371542.1 dihydrofolate reductase [Conexibacter sp. JD483]
MIAIVVAHAANGTIGRDGDLPWRLPSDLRQFRAITHGGTVVMGRRTWESIPARFRPLPGRRNVVLSRDPAYAPDGAELFGSLAEALAACDHDCFVIGGSATYAEALPLAQRCYITHVEGDVEGDAVFPLLDADEWTCVEAGETREENGHRFAFRVHERR